MKLRPIEHLEDLQSAPDDRRIPIDQVGIKDLRYPIVIRDKAHAEQSTIAHFTLTVDLPHQHKGTHMSRFVEALGEHGPVIHIDNVREILTRLKEKFQSQKAHVRFEFPFFLEKKAPVSGAVGLMDYTVRFEATQGAADAESDFIATVIVPVTTLCPCSQAISEHGAHNQRGRVTYSVRFHRPIWIEDLIALVESCASCELYSLLKRPDEKAVTERAWSRPVFVEDLVRDVAAKSDREPNILWYRVEAENFESIHNHNAYAVVERRK